MSVPVEVLSADQVERLLAQPDRDDLLGLRDAALLSTLYHAAATPVELTTLELRDVRLPRGRLALRGEDGSRRRVVLPEEAAGLLARYLEESRPLLLTPGAAVGRDSGAVFLANRGQRIRVQDVRQIVGAVATAAGLRGAVHLNTLRLSRAWHLREQGESPESIQRFLGATSRSGRNVI